MTDNIHKELLNRYRIIQEIGHGTQGRVYEARRLKDNRRVAIKELRVDSVKSWKSYDLFLREGEVLKNLNVPGVAKVYETVEYLDAEIPSAYIVQEYIEGETIQAMMKRGYRFSFQNVCTIAIRLLDILNSLHHYDPPVIHRDIKPSNVMILMENKAVKELHLIDFGAVANPQIQSGGSTVAGTYGYMAPEQLMGNPCPATDTYAVGVMIAYMLSGVEPVNMEVDHFKLNITPYLKSQPGDVIQLLNRMIKPDCQERLSDTEKLRNSFVDLKNNKFSLSSLISSGYNSKNYNKKLLSCHYPGEQRNLQLWEDFPDDVRMELPNEIENIVFSDKKESKPEKTNGGIITHKNMLFFGCVISFILSVLSFVIYVLHLVLDGFNSHDDLSLWIWFFVGSVVCFFIGLKLSDLYLSKNPIKLPSDDSEIIQQEKYDRRKNILRWLFTNGIKVMGTVVEIRCVQADSPNDELDLCIKNIHYNSRQNALVLSQHGLRNFFRTEGNTENINIRPLYEIKYRFKFGYEIYDSVVRTYCNPFIKLRIGDEFPALCYQHFDKTVQSLPYPWDLEELSNNLSDDNLTLVADCVKYKIKLTKINFVHDSRDDSKFTSQKQYMKNQNNRIFEKPRNTNKMNVRGSGRR